MNRLVADIGKIRINKDLGSIFIVGSAFSGKSEYAVELLRKDAKTAVVGTCDDSVDAMLANRVAHLKALRPKGWEHFERPDLLVELLESITPDFDQILIDSLSQHLTAMLVRSADKYSDDQLYAHLLSEGQSLAAYLKKQSAHRTIVVTSSEFGGSLPPSQRDAKMLRQALGEANKLIARTSRHVVHLVSGIPVCIKGDLA